MKRKAEDTIDGEKSQRAKKRNKKASFFSDTDVKSCFHSDLFAPSTLAAHQTSYAFSAPYHHSVISPIIEDTLLRVVRSEIQTHVSFTRKETDIYRIHQSGDLANLDGLDDAALTRLPSLLRLRDALYSRPFRDFISHVTGCGALSGRKTDMAVNVYTPGCHLLCHDDVIASRRVSYILYLIDPDTPWKPEWGGALRLFPVEEAKGKDGEVAKTVLPDHVKSIPPAWNQLSFFAVQPGRSFHDVEEVYWPGRLGDGKQARQAAMEKNGGRARMAISGWFHIPQPGEEGFMEGAEEANARDSGRAQLQGNPDQHDLPAVMTVDVPEKERVALAVDGNLSKLLDEADIDFLLRYLNPQYLTPDIMLSVAEHFNQEYSIALPTILSRKFGARLREYLEGLERKTLPERSDEAEKVAGGWKVARPPHKHRYMYLQAGAGKEPTSPLQELLEDFLPSRPFRVWLQQLTRCVIRSHDLQARRFRRGQDYTLATNHWGKPRLDVNIIVTPSQGWGGKYDDDEEKDEEGEGHEGEVADEEVADSEAETIHSGAQIVDGKASPIDTPSDQTNGKCKGKGKEPEPSPEIQPQEEKEGDEDEADATTFEDDFGGAEVYMAGEETLAEEAADADAAAVYQGAKPSEEDDDDNVLFAHPPSWNKMTIVLRDLGTLRFVKYVSRSAPGDRWDVAGTFEIEEGEDEGADGKGEAEVGRREKDETGDEEVFRGFISSHNSESD